VEQPYFDRVVETVRRRLDPESISRAWQEGGALSLEHALLEAEAAVRDAATPYQSAAVVEQALPVSSPPQAPVASAPLREHAGLRVRALGPLEIFRGDELLGTERWSYAKPRELLLYLLCNPQGATKEQIGKAIWPEATAAQVRNNLHVTLHYVRKALGSTDWIVFREDRYWLDRERKVEFDLEMFAEEAASILRDPDAAADTRLREVLSLYGSDFLACELFGAWHLEWRDRALSQYVALLSVLAGRLFAREEYGEGKQLYQQIVAREELREDMQRRLMQCLARSGNRAQALRHGERLVTLLREELDAEPEPETTELCERLRRAENI
jgi:DNA-binding SARP family transcriptional activator